MSSSKTWALLWALFISAMIVAGCGLAVSYKALSRAEFYAAQCTLLMAENELLRGQLEASRVKRHELVIAVVGDDNGKKPLALATRNYLNLKRSSNGEKFLGEIGVDTQGHVIFKDAAYSVRAGGIVLKTYEKKHKIKTVRGLVKRFAEGNQEQYIKHICRELGVGPDEEFSFSARMPELLKAMIRFETGLDLAEEHISLLAALR